MRLNILLFKMILRLGKVAKVFANGSNFVFDIELQNEVNSIIEDTEAIINHLESE